MKYLAALFLMSLVALTVGQERPLPLENIDVENTLRNEKLVNRYVDCVLERGRCDKNGKDLKDMLPRVLNENCVGCSPKQVVNSNKIIDFMKKNRMPDWTLINAKYSRS